MEREPIKCGASGTLVWSASHTSVEETAVLWGEKRKLIEEVRKLNIGS